MGESESELKPELGWMSWAILFLAGARRSRIALNERSVISDRVVVMSRIAASGKWLA